MSLSCAVLSRLGSRYSLVLDPHRREIGYGALGLHCQGRGGLRISAEDGAGHEAALPFAGGLAGFDTLEQHETMTGVRYVACSLALGIRMTVRFTAPFYPRDERTSLIPAYIIDIDVEPIRRIRWSAASADAARAGRIRIGLELPGAHVCCEGNRIAFDYDVEVSSRFKTAEGGIEATRGSRLRKLPIRGRASDRIIPLAGGFLAADGELHAPFDLSAGESRHYRAALIGYCGDALFERFTHPMRLRYTEFWPDADAVADDVTRTVDDLLEKSRFFDSLFTESDLPHAAQLTLAQAFRSYLQCTIWCVPGNPRDPALPADWFSVWEGSCRYNSTVDVTFNESPFYFACWPELLERIFAQWAEHANDFERESARCRDIRAQTGHGPDSCEPFPGLILEHDMGAGWTCNGQSYHHAMPVEENANFLLLLHCHSVWWCRPELPRAYADLCRGLVEYLLHADSTGNGFPDRGTANTIDDANPAVQYGRDNVYLGVKRLAALHAARRIFEALGDDALAGRCAAEVARAVDTFGAGRIGDHWGVCLDKSAKGLLDAWSGKPLPYDELPGWDAYSIYTANGLLPLLMIDDLPEGLDLDALRTDLVAAERACRSEYGCGHSSEDPGNVWVSMNMWRDAVAGYLGIDMLPNAERYLALQQFANGPGAEKANGFSETTLRNNLVQYPRGTAAFAWLFGAAGLRLAAGAEAPAVSPSRAGRIPLLPLADWEGRSVPVLDAYDDPADPSD